MQQSHKLKAENAELRRQVEQLTALLSKHNIKIEDPKPMDVDQASSLSTANEIQLLPQFKPDGSPQVLAVVTSKKRKRPSRANKRKRRRPRVVASRTLDLLPQIPCLSNEKRNTVKQRLFNRLRKDEDIRLITQRSIENILEEGVKEHDTAFYLVNLGDVIDQFLKWKRLLPRVRPFYAVKSNPDINIVKILQILGAGFDCASKEELMEALKVGALPQDIIFANPSKPKDHLAYASSQGIKRMTFDSPEELKKIHRCFPDAEVVLRFLPDDSHSLMPFGTKFGASFKECLELFELAKELKMKLIGLSFHVGSGCYSEQAFVDAVKLARSLFDEAKKVGFNFTLLDCGGGYPGDDVPGEITFPKIAKALGPALDELFPPEVTIIAEPGRYFCHRSYTLAVNVVSKREQWIPSSEEGAGPVKQALYYLSDGIYGSFNNIVFDHAHPQPMILGPAASPNSPTTRSKLFGPTCDSIDVVLKDVELPNLEVGNWLYFTCMGAYTRASATSFNGFKPPNAKYVVILGDDDSE